MVCEAERTMDKWTMTHNENCGTLLAAGALQRKVWTVRCELLLLLLLLLDRTSDSHSFFSAADEPAAAAPVAEVALVVVPLGGPSICSRMACWCASKENKGNEQRQKKKE